MGPNPLQSGYFQFQAVNKITPGWEYLVQIMQDNKRLVKPQNMN